MAFTFSKPSSSLPALDGTTKITDFLAPSDNDTFGAIIMQPGARPATDALAAAYQVLAEWTNDDIAAPLVIFNTAIDAAEFGPSQALHALTFVLGYDFALTSTSGVSIKPTRKRWIPEQALACMAWLIKAYGDERGSLIDAAFASFSLKDKRSRAVALRSTNCTGLGDDADQVLRARIESERVALWNFIETAGLLAPSISTPAAKLADLVAKMTAPGADAIRKSVLMQMPAVMRSMMANGDDPRLLPGFSDLAPALVHNLCLQAGIKSQVSDPALQFKALSAIGHPAGIDGLKSSADSLFQAAGGFMGGGSSHDQIFGGHAPGTHDTWLSPDVPRPTRHIPPYNRNNIDSCPKANDFLTDPTPQQRQLALAKSDMSLQQDGTFRLKAATVTSPELKNAQELSLGAHRMGSYCVATNIMSTEVRLAHDKFIFFLIELHSTHHRPWQLIKTVYKKFMESMHSGAISSFGDRDALARLITFHETTSTRRTGDDGQDDTRTKRQRRNDRQAAAKAAAAAGGGDGGGGGGGRSTSNKDTPPKTGGKKRWHLMDPLEWQGDALCFDHQIGRCKHGDSCHRKHGHCGVCGATDHLAPACEKRYTA